MAVTITETRTVADEFDATTNLSSPVAGESLVVFTADPSPVELTGCIGMAVGTETSDIITTITSDDLSNTLVYVWTLANGTMDTLTNGGVAIILGDATNLVGYHLAGSDAAGFRHAAGPVGWQCLILDTASLPASKTQLQGAVDPTLTTITRIGAMYKTLSKALGGSSNCFTDVVRYGNDGLVITGGANGSPYTGGTFDEIAIEDRSDTSTKAYGAIRELGAGLYGLQAPLTFGDDLGSPQAATYFADTDVTVTFEDRSIGTANYYINVVGNAVATTTFKLGIKVGTTGGSNGCTLSCPTGVGASFTASDTNLQILYLYGSTISGFSNGITLSSDATNAPNHEVFACTFAGNGQIAPGLVQFKNNSIAVSTDANGSLLLPSSTSAMADLSFISDGTGHAIYITTTGTYTFDNFTFSGFGSDDTTDAAVYNNSGGLVTINVAGGGDSPTVRNSTGSPVSTTVVNNAVTVRVQGVTEAAAIKVVANETIGTITSGDIIFEKLANSSGVAEITGFNYQPAFDTGSPVNSGLDVIVRARASGLPAAAIQDDNGVFADQTTAANSATTADMNLLPTTPVVNEDRYIFGHPEMFNKMKLLINTAGTGGFTITWQYWNGAWTNLADVSDGTSSFSNSGENTVSWTMPGDWATTTINGQGPYYYIRAAYTAGTVTIVPLGTRCKLDVTKYLPYVQNFAIVSTGLTVTASWQEDTIATF